MDHGNTSNRSQSPIPTSRVTAALQERISLYSALARQPRRTDTSWKHLCDIELELWDIETALATLRRQRNAFISVSSFPPEILTYIFHNLAELEPHYIQHPEQYDKILSDDFKVDLGWIKVTQICHAWREAAFADSQLWTSVTTLFGEDWAQRMLQLGRSQPKELDIVRGRVLSIRSQLVAYSDVLYNVSRLRIMSGGDDVSEIADVHAPALKSLHIHASFDDEFGTVPDTLFGDVIPHLQDLYVHNLAVSLDAPFILFLTRLSLSMNTLAFPIDIQYQTLVSTLNSLRSLESLTVQSYSIEVVDEDIFNSNAFEIISPRLTYVNVHISGWHAAFLLMAQVRASNAARMTFAAIFPYQVLVARDTIILDIFRRRIATFDISSLCDMQTIEWRTRTPRSELDIPICDGPAPPLRNGHYAILSTWRDDCSGYLLRDYQDYCDRPIPLPDFQLILGIRPGSTPPRLDTLIPFTAFPAARSLSVRPVHNTSFDVSFDNGWRELFGVAKSLAWLRVDRDAGEDMLLGVHRDRSLSTESGSFPEALRTLAMLGVRWDHDWNQPSGPRVNDMLNDLGWSSNIHEVIVGIDSYEGGIVRVEWPNAILSNVKRLESWVRDESSDWDSDWDEMVDH